MLSTNTRGRERVTLRNETIVDRKTFTLLRIDAEQIALAPGTVTRQRRALS
jgi:hypothetical protein